MANPPKFFGIEVDFPYEQPYQAQRALMAKAMTGFVRQENALLESPTGTGKTIALLASSLAYQDYMKATHPEAIRSNFDLGLNDSASQSQDNTTKIPQIWYTSRTHQQLKQLVKELRQIKYTPTMAILGSRGQMCINSKVLNMKDRENGCKQVHQKLHECPYGNNTQANYFPPEFRKGGTDKEDYLKYDIEDLQNFCREKNKCPYIVSRNIAKQADLILAPYNYVIDGSIRQQMKTNISGAILIIDEAHNIESTCRDSATLRIKLLDILRLCDWSSMNEAEQMLYTNLVQPLKTLNGLFEKFRDYITNKRTEYERLNTQNSGNKYNNNNLGKYLTEENTEVALREHLNLTATFWPTLNGYYKEVSKIDNENTNNDESRYPHEAFMVLLHNVFRKLQCIFSENGQNIGEFKLVYQYDDNSDEDSIMILCLSPAVVFRPISQLVHNVILTSGTLSPLDSFISELGVTFPILLSALHVIDPSQVLTFTLSRAVNGEVLSSSYKSMKVNSDGTYHNIAGILRKILPNIPYGVLLFMPSKQKLHGMVTSWKKLKGSDGVDDFHAIDAIKRIFVEDNDINKVYRNYQSHIKSGEGGIFLGVCRGKMSEGMNFTDNQARAVIAFGIPYPSIYEADIYLKRLFNDQTHKTMRGDEWYEAQAFRSLFQAVGRCIRHRNDYGTIILLDERYEKDIQKFPKWVSRCQTPTNGYDDMNEKLKRFYGEMKVKYPTKDNAVEEVSVDAPFDLTCSSCTARLYEQVAINPKSTKLLESRGFLQTVHEQKGMFVYIMKNEDKKATCVLEEKSQWFEDESIAYKLLKCPKCEITVGARIEAASEKNASQINSSLLLLDRFFAHQAGLSSPLDRIVQKPKVMTLQTCCGDSKQATLSFV